MTNHPNEWYMDGLRLQKTEVFNSVFRDFLPQVAHFIRNNSGTDEDAKDVFMDAVMVVYQKIKADDLILTAAFSTYLIQICRWQWYKILRRKKFDAGVTPEDPAVFNTTAVPDDLHFEQTERYRLMTEKFKQLQKDCQRVLSLSWHTDLSMEEVAEHMGWTYAYARKRKHVCKEYLITAIESDPRYSELRA